MILCLPYPLHGFPPWGKTCFTIWSIGFFRGVKLWRFYDLFFIKKLEFYSTLGPLFQLLSESRGTKVGNSKLKVSGIYPSSSVWTPGVVSPFNLISGGPIYVLELFTGYVTNLTFFIDGENIRLLSVFPLMEPRSIHPTHYPTPFQVPTVTTYDVQNFLVKVFTRKSDN